MAKFDIIKRNALESVENALQNIESYLNATQDGLKDHISKSLLMDFKDKLLKARSLITQKELIARIEEIGRASCRERV